MKKHLLTFLCFIALWIALPLSARAASLNIDAALIQGDQVVVLTSGSAASDDGILHLYAQECYESGLQGIEVAQAPAGAAPVFALPLGKNTPASVLFKKFTVVAVRGGRAVQVSNTKYITNPEASATHTMPRMDGFKKGLLPNGTIEHPETLRMLDIHQIVYNLNIGTLVSGGGFNYNYNGKTYSFDINLIRGFDSFIPKMNANGIQVSLILLNNLAPNPSLLHPMSMETLSTNYYAYNTANAQGVELIEAVASFLGERYSGTGHGTVDNYIIGNEVNAFLEWNYLSPGASMNTHVGEYAKALRLFYNGIRSQNGNARIFVPVDNEWARATGRGHFGARPYLVTLNSIINSEGNIFWNVGAHPYNADLSDPVAWHRDPRSPHSQNATFYSMENIDVLTDFLCTSGMRAPDGSVRRVICSEVGYSSTNNPDAQAASVVFAYYQCLNNQYIDGLALSREQDHPAELAAGCAYGLIDLNGVGKPAIDFYRYADNPEYVARAEAIMGRSLLSCLTPR